MASSPEQEIPQEIVEAVGIEYLLRMPVGSSIEKEPLRAALAAVLPDLQRPLLEETERLKAEIASLEADAACFVCGGSGETDGPMDDAGVRPECPTCEGAGTLTVDAVRVMGLTDVAACNERQSEWITRALTAEAERDARPDLDDDEKQVAIEALDPTQWNSPYDGVARSAREKLERSLDAHKP